MSDSPYINHFLQPDTIIPGVANPQSWNRYSYVLNNPVNASDPTGHKCVGNPEECLNNDGTASAGFAGGGKAPGARNCEDTHCHGVNGSRWEPEIIVPSFDDSQCDGMLTCSQPDTPWEVIPKDFFKLITNQVQPGTLEELILRCSQGTANGDVSAECQIHGPMLGFDVSGTNGMNLLIDSISLIASFVAMNWATQATKQTMVISGGLSGFNSASQGDSVGVGLSVGGFAPPPFGIAASAGSVMRDLMSAVYEVQPLGPPVPTRWESSPHKWVPVRSPY